MQKQRISFVLAISSAKQNKNVTVFLGTFLLLLLGFPVMEKQQVLFVLSSFLLKVCLHHQAHLEYKR